MASFHSQFQSYFTAEERESELYRVLATIGVNVEKTILEEINAEIRRASEISRFPENKLRSWLAYFLMPVRNVVSARGVGRITLLDPGTVTISPSEVNLIGRNGLDYELRETLMLSGSGSSLPFSFVQGRTVVTAPLTYSEFLSIPIDSGNVDLTDIRVTFSDGQDIPMVQSFPVNPFDLDSAYVKDYISPGDSDAKVEGLLLNSLNALWTSVNSVSVRPSGGFFPFFYNNTLFIKIYPDIGAGVVLPDGRGVIVTYRLSDGVLGNIGKDQFRDFSGSIMNADGDEVELEITNEPARNGVNEPSYAELVNLLRRRFFASTHVSSIPEYTTWFLSQPEVGDCLVVSDYLKWRMSARTDFGADLIQGIVEIYLLDKRGEIIDPNRDRVLIGYLDDRLTPVRDIAFLEYRRPLVYWHFYLVQYRSVFNEINFMGAAESSVQTLYSVEWAQANSRSLFSDMDMELVTNMMRAGYDPVGLRVIPFHYIEVPYNLAVHVQTELKVRYYRGEKPGGWYEFYEYDEDTDSFGYYITIDGEIAGFIKGEPAAVYREFVEATGSVVIYRYKKTSVEGGWTWGTLWGDTEDSWVGSRSPVQEEAHDSGMITIRMDENLRRGVLRCFWAIENEGTMPVGSESPWSFGLRKLPSGGNDPENIVNDKTFFEEKVRFEKYI